MALTSEERKSAARPRQTRTFFVLLRAHRHESLDADFQPLLAQSSRQEPGGPEPVDAGLLALATLVQASGHVGERDAVELTVMDTRWPRVLDGLGAEPPPCRQGTLCTCRRRRIAHDVAKTLLDRTGALAEHPGGVGARPRRAVLDAPPLVGAGRVADPLTLLGHALRQAGGLAAQALGPSTVARREAAGLTLVGPSRLTAALDLDGGESRARARARGLLLEEGARGQHGLEQPPPLTVQAPPLQAVMETITPMSTPETAPAPAGGPGGRRIPQPVAPDRRLAIEEKALRPGRTSSATPCNGVQEHWAVDLESPVTREVVVRPAHEPAQEAGERLAATLEHAPGLWPRASDLGSRASPRIAPWAAQGVSLSARPWPHGGPLFPKQAVPWACAARQGTCPGGHTVPRVPGKEAQCPAAACDRCPLRAPCTTATLGPGRSLHRRADAPCQQTRRTQRKTPRGRASRRTRTAVEHTMAHQLAHQGRRARSKGLRKHQCDGRRHAAVSHLQSAAHEEEEHRLAS